MGARTSVTDTNYEFEAHCQAAGVLFAVKDKEYGSAYKRYGVLGVVCEILGVVERLPQMVLWSLDHGKSSREKLIDIFKDLHNFSNMALICLEANNWDGRKDA